MKIKLPHGTTAENNQLTLPPGYLTIDTEKKALRFHDGVTQGGFEVLGTQAWVPGFGEQWMEVANSSIFNNNGNWSDFIISDSGDVFVSRQQVGGLPIGKANLSALPTVTVFSAINYTEASASGKKYIFDNAIALHIQSQSSGQQGRIYISIDGGSNFLQYSYGGGFSDLIEFNGRLIFRVSNTFLSSELATPNSVTTRYTDATYRLGDFFVIVGTRLYAISGQATEYTDDGINWTALGPHTNGNLGSSPSIIFHRGGYFYGVFGTTIYRSTDAHTWTSIQTPGWTSWRNPIDSPSGVVMMVNVSSTWRLALFNETAGLFELLNTAGLPTLGGSSMRLHNNKIYMQLGNVLYRSV